MNTVTRLGLCLIGILALAQISPARVRGWAYQSGAFEPAADSAPGKVVSRIRTADLDRDGAGESVWLADAGAAVVWGHHPHVLQPAAWLKGTGSARPTLVAYSLGNALFDQVAPSGTRRSALLLLVLDQNGAVDARTVPFEIDVRHGRVRPVNCLLTSIAR